MLRKIIYWILAVIIIAVAVMLTSVSVPFVVKLIIWALAITMTFATLKYQRDSGALYEKIIFWVLAIVITTSTAVYQRLTGPTYEIDGSVEFAGHTISYSLPRTHGGDGDKHVALQTGGAPLQAILHLKRYKADAHFALQPMIAMADSLVGYLPHQPPAGKLEYYIELKNSEDGELIFIPGPETVVIRFKGAVPMGALLPHVFLMFFGMLWSNRTGLEALSKESSTRTLTISTTVIMILGGLIMGPVVQKYAFGAFWTGAPFGWDLTDNKTLLFVIVWAIALWRHRKHPNPRYFVLAAALVTFAMYMIPHSMMGSELDYSTGEVMTGD